MFYAGILFYCNEHHNHVSKPPNTNEEIEPNIFKHDRDERSTFSLPTMKKQCNTIRKCQKISFDSAICQENYDSILYLQEASQRRYNCVMSCVQNLRDRMAMKDMAYV